MESTELYARLQQLSLAFAEIPFNRMLGLRLEQMEPGHVRMSFNMKNDLIGNFMYGILHGGVISSVLDMAGGIVVMSETIRRHTDTSTEDLIAIISKCSTIDLQISFLRPGKGERFIASAWLVKGGRNISFARMELHNQDNNLIAMGNGTYAK